MNKLISLTAVGMIFCLGAPAKATQPHNAVVQDHYKTVIVKIPTEYEVCSQGNGKRWWSFGCHTWWSLKC